jgi:hypothetical protein
MGMIDNVRLLSGNMSGAQSRTSYLATTTTDQSMISRLTGLSARMGASSSSTMSLGNNANDSVMNMFSPASGSAVAGLNNMGQCLCEGMVDELQGDFMRGLGTIMEGAGLEDSMRKTQEMLDYANSLSSIDEAAYNRLAGMADDAMSSTASKMRDIAGAVGEATGITAVTRDLASSLSMMSAVMNTCTPKGSIFGMGNVRDMLSRIWPNFGFAIDMGLMYDQNSMRDAICGLIGSSGMGDDLIEHQNSLNDYVSSFMS